MYLQLILSEILDKCLKMFLEALEFFAILGFLKNDLKRVVANKKM